MLRKISLAYLVLVPFAAAVIALTIGRSDYRVYLPLWLINSLLMVTAAWIIGANAIKSNDPGKKRLVITALFIFIPWIFISIFAGMGPPPSTITGWVETATEQQIRYCILIGSGVMFTAGFALLKEKLNRDGENFYSILGFTAIAIMIPLFILNMAFWGSFLITSFKSFVASGTDKRPELYLALKDLFYLIAVTYVALTYLATAAFAVSLRKIRWFSAGASNAYVVVSFIGLVFSVLPPSSPEPFATLSYITSIPAIPFIMPYLMALNLLRLAAK